MSQKGEVNLFNALKEMVEQKQHGLNGVKKVTTSSDFVLSFETIISPNGSVTMRANDDVVSLDIDGELRAAVQGLYRALYERHFKETAVGIRMNG